MNSSQYDERDLDKIRSDESFVGQYIRPQESMEEVSDRMSESLKFRMEYGMNGQYSVCKTTRNST